VGLVSLKRSLVFAISLAVIGSSSCAENGFQAVAPRGHTPEPSQTLPGGVASSVDGGEAAALPQTDLPQIKQQVGGVPGGHFDLDTSIATYPFSAGQTAHHVHEYDDKFGTTGVDFFNLLDSRFVKPNLQIPAERVFRILIANGQFSPGARLLINGQSFTAQEWASKSATRRFSFAGVPGTEKLGTFQVVFAANSPISSQLIGTTTGLVRSNAPGPQGSYRAGALTIQCIDDAGAEIDATLGVIKLGSPSMLWEATLFYHQEASPPKP